MTEGKLRYQVYGLVFLLVVAGLVWVAIGFYRKAFTTVVPVSLETDRVGNQLREGSDVKLRGMIVGEVRSIRPTGDRAVLDLAIDPDSIDLIPDNVSAQLLPKTLFGERYIALQLPAAPSPTPLREGSVIPQDRTKSAIEIERVLDHLMPLLQAVQPEKLATTLSAMSTALDGRGEKFGETIVELNAYLERFLPSLPDLRADLTALAVVADTYADAAPDLLAAMSDLTTTTRTIVEQRSNLDALYASTTTAAVDLERFLAVNKNNLIELADTSQSTLAVLAKYAPEYPCLLENLVKAIPASERAFGKGTDHPNVSRVTMEIAASRGKYLPGVDTPRYDDKRGPRCYRMAQPGEKFPQYTTDGPLKDGSSKPPPPRSDRPEQFRPTIPQNTDVPLVANTPAERDLVNALIAPGLGVMPDDVPEWASLLVGPAFRGVAVSLR
ncbi:MCE-family protein Mce1A [Alloactinosynnema sp. L-07]|uniref:MCE family protein n=1 Tax=Alloactinosynnema sp. L-07 TaxID=1653480 RepID=UPI00065EFD91|nr:MCE family protein [Alloactinosynnema sp. L-07]CRK59556.1 MCE-family protein Mce1A [Alloactinosynnema sp. L-07]